ncbi:hypothetical protein P171DRAFT_477955 [Karstenula rhodostoma CBS 690.94]|uniref:Uncharacterized protein n=1 Tax=Karstenula rhodostoma CBS 690.94 TaxID=1392251 RepID=A0A9P4P674_9PLEO|nr:hypothetical protein P171DRAFT_477955 [Karstenula rhodostoma CBS 690.94]
MNYQRRRLADFDVANASPVSGRLASCCKRVSRLLRSVGSHALFTRNDITMDTQTPDMPAARRHLDPLRSVVSRLTIPPKGWGDNWAGLLEGVAWKLTDSRFKHLSSHSPLQLRDPGPSADQWERYLVKGADMQLPDRAFPRWEMSEVITGDDHADIVGCTLYDWRTEKSAAGNVIFASELYCLLALLHRQLVFAKHYRLPGGRFTVTVVTFTDTCVRVHEAYIDCRADDQVDDAPVIHIAKCLSCPLEDLVCDVQPTHNLLRNAQPTDSFLDVLSYLCFTRPDNAALHKHATPTAIRSAPEYAAEEVTTEVTTEVPTEVTTEVTAVGHINSQDKPEHVADAKNTAPLPIRAKGKPFALDVNDAENAPHLTPRGAKRTPQSSPRKPLSPLPNQ